MKKLIENINDMRKSLNEISVYDLNVYSAIELYYKLALKTNEVIKELSRFEGVISDEIIEQNEKLTYLLGEGLNIEVVKKINQMVADGTMDTIINHNVFNSLNNKIEDITINVKDFGAVGDGIHDDSIAIQNAINSISGGTILIPKGVYKIGHDGDNLQNDKPRINITNSNIKIVGDKSIILNGVYNGLSTFSISGKNIKIENLVFDGSNTSTNQIHIKNTAKFISIVNCEVKNCRQQVGQTVVASGIMLSCGCENVTIDNCYIHDVNAEVTKISRGIYGTGYESNNNNYMKNITINNCTIENIYPVEDADGIQIQTVSADEDVNLIITNCKFKNCTKRAMKIQCSGALVENNIIDTVENMYSAISIYGNNVTVTNNKINGKQIYNGVECGSKITPIGKNIIISNNIINANDTTNIMTGVLLTSSSSTPLNNVCVNSNIIKNVNDGIYIDCHGSILQVNSNNISNCARYGIFNVNKVNVLSISSNVLSNISKYVIRDNGNSSNMSMTNNVSDMVGWSPFSNLDDGDKVVTGNILNGFPTQVYGDNIPTSGTWKKGDIIWNKGNNNTCIGWVCNSGGSPGSWKSISNISISGTSSQRPQLSSSDIGYLYFDDTLSKPIWWNGRKWMDSNGSQV